MLLATKQGFFVVKIKPSSCCGTHKNSLYKARKYAWIFVPGQSLFGFGQFTLQTGQDFYQIQHLIQPLLQRKTQRRTRINAFSFSEENKKGVRPTGLPLAPLAPFGPYEQNTEIQYF